MIHIVDGRTDRILDYIPLGEFWDDWHRKSLKDTLETFDFTTFGDRRYSQHLTKRNRVIIPDDDGRLVEFIIENTRKYRDTDGSLIIEVYTVASYLELTKAKVIEPQTLASQTPSTAVAHALAGTEWLPGNIQGDGTRTFHIEQYTNPYSFTQTIATEFDVERNFRIEHDGNKVTGRFLDLVERIGQWQGREVEFTKDLAGIERKEDMSGIVTALVGLGPEREDGTRLTVFVEDQDALQRWGRPHPQTGQLMHLVETYEPESADQDMTIERLTELTRNELEKRINSVVEYSADVVDLEKVPGLQNKVIRFGDTIKIKDLGFSPPLYLEARVHTQERSLSDPANKRVILGDFIEYTEEEVQEIWRQLQAQIARKIELSDVLEVTYTKPEIDAKDSSVYQDSTQYSDIVSETKKQEAIQVAADDATQKANQAEQNAKQYTEQYAEQKAPSVTPAVPANFSATGSFKKVVLTWDIDTSKVVAYYELYASQTAGFTPSSTNLIYKGKTSGFTHDVDVSQTWYYRLRAVNAYGQAGAFTDEVSASTVKIISDDILFGAVNAQHIADLAVTAQKLADGAVTDTKIANAAVGNAAIQNGAITNAKIGTAAVGTAQIQDAAITNAKIADLAVDNAKIANLHGSKITAGTVTADKLNVTSLSAISANLGTVTAGTINGVTINGSTINSRVDARNYTTIANNRIHSEGEWSDTVYGLGSMYGIFDVNNGNISLEVGQVLNGTRQTSQAVNIDFTMLGMVIKSGTSGGFFINNIGAISWGDWYDSGNARGAIYTSYEPDAYNTLRWGVKVESPYVNITQIIAEGNARQVAIRERDNNNKQWHIEVNNGDFFISETNVATRLTLTTGGGLLINWMNATGDINFSNYTGRLVNDSGNGYLQTTGNEYRVTKYKSTTYIPIRAASFPTGSLAEYKQDIHVWEESALEKIRSATIYEYRLKSEVEAGKNRWRQGLVIGDGFSTPEGVIDGDGVEQYLMNAWSWKAIQELDSKQMNHEDRISWLELENKYLKQKVSQLETRIAELEAKIA